MNIVLIGMPGSGKTTVGRGLALALGRDFFETDSLIEEVEGRSIPAIFAEEGEPYFRTIESLVAADVAGVSNAVIATGGGMILREENMAALCRTGHILFLDRPPEEIVAENHRGRPLLADDHQKVFELYTDRIDLYRKYARYTILCGPQVTDTLNRAMELIGREAL